MIRPTPRTPRSSGTLRAAAAAASVAGIAVIAGCAASTPAEPVETEDAPAATPSANVTGESDAADATASGDSVYVDGTYTAEGSYQTPESVEAITVTVTLEDDVVTAVNVVGNPQKAESKRYQAEFIGGIQDVVVGTPIDELQVSRVAGSSLTSGGFNAAIEEIKAEAAA